MTDIVKGILDGGWALLVGWVLPAALNVLVFALVVYPSVDDLPLFRELEANVGTLVGAAVILGVVLSALQTPLYRILEGYVWPTRLFRWGQQRQIRRRECLKYGLNLTGYIEAKNRHSRAEQQVALARHTSDQKAREQTEDELQRAADNLERWTAAGTEAEAWFADSANVATGFWHRTNRSVRMRAMSRLQRQARAEQFRRYPPIDKTPQEDQILPTALGNAIRRFERFGPIHYNLDQQLLWYELMAVVPERVSKQVGQMRTAVDFFVSLVVGQLVIAITAAIAFFPDQDRRAWLGFGALVTVVLSFLAYRFAVVATDEWAFAVQALLNVGRKPLAAALSLELPPEMEEERKMWRVVGQFLQPKPPENASSQLDRYRAQAVSPGELETLAEQASRDANVDGR